MTDVKPFPSLLERLRTCTCHESYTKRKMWDPNCQFHSGLHAEAADEIVELQALLNQTLDELDAWKRVATRIARVLAVYQTMSPN
jgi:hypothetical protein